MATNRTAIFAIPVAAMLLLWPALWNGYPIVFADTGTYLSQAINHYAGWDRPIFYSLFMLPLHWTITVWPVVMVQALLAAWMLWLVVRALLGDVSGFAFVAGVGVLSVCSWLPWLVSELMPDVFTPLLVLALCLLAWVPERLARWEQTALVGLATFLIASQQSSVPLACVLGVGLLVCNRAVAGRVERLPAGIGRDASGRLLGVDLTSWSGQCEPPLTPWANTGGSNQLNRDGPEATDRRAMVRWTPVSERDLGVTGGGAAAISLRRRWLLIILAPALAVLCLCTVNLAAFGRFATSPFGNIFLLARIIYDGPGMAVLRRDCPTAAWRLCPFLDRFPATSDEFLWTVDSPLHLVGDAKLVSRDAGAIIEAALRSDPKGELRAVASNTMEQAIRFASGDGLNPWPAQVTPWIERDFPAREQAAYASARQQRGLLSVPSLLSQIHMAGDLGGVLACLILLPVAFRRRAACAGFLLGVLLILPVSAAITGGLSAPHERYQARIMWLPPFVAIVSLASLRRRTA